MRIALDSRDPHQAVRVRIVQRPQHYGPGYAEHRAVRANAERRREDRDGGEGRRLEEHAQAEAQVGEERLHPADGPQTSCRPPRRETPSVGDLVAADGPGVSGAGTAPSVSGADSISPPLARPLPGAGRARLCLAVDDGKFDALSTLQAAQCAPRTWCGKNLEPVATH